jgi:hypothetical protein
VVFVVTILPAIGIMYPDVEVMLSRPAGPSAHNDLPNSVTPRPATPATLTIPVLDPIDVRVPTVEIRDSDQTRQKQRKLVA